MLRLMRRFAQFTTVLEVVGPVISEDVGCISKQEVWVETPSSSQEGWCPLATSHFAGDSRPLE